MKKPRQVLRRALLLVLTAAALAADSKYHLQVTRYELRFAALPAALDGYRIVLLSDLHGAYFGRDNARLTEKVAALSPDLIALTGDFADCRECHITPDWLLVYQTDSRELVLYMIRTGSHSDLF